jgi:hypothetical protein
MALEKRVADRAVVTDHRAFRWLRPRAAVASQAVREYLSFDTLLLRPLLARAAYLAGLGFLAAGDGRRAMSTLGAIHRSSYSPAVNLAVERQVKRAFEGDRFARPLAEACVRRRSVQDPADIHPAVRAAPERVLASLVMVLRSPGSRHKGILNLRYNFVFPFFASNFDLAAILRRYHIVIEPSWSGYCDLDVLSLAHLSSPVFVQAYEPLDRQFIERVAANLVVVPTSSNWWVDHRVFTPVAGIEKDADLVMVAGWGAYKRHAAFFRALRALRQVHRSLKVILVGYELGLTLADVLAIADLYGVADMLECHERVSQPEVNVLLNRARLNVIWSRKEGVNRSIIEGMFANVPCIVRDGWNYGYRYEYINESTGAYATESSLPDTILRMLEASERMHPREWVMRNMSCQIAARLMAQTIALHTGEPEADATSEVAVKVNGLGGMQYWDSVERDRFEDDYRFLRSVMTPASA